MRVQEIFGMIKKQKVDMEGIISIKIVKYTGNELKLTYTYFYKFVERYAHILFDAYCL